MVSSHDKTSSVYYKHSTELKCFVLYQAGASKVALFTTLEAGHITCSGSYFRVNSDWSSSKVQGVRYLNFFYAQKQTRAQIIQCGVFLVFIVCCIKSIYPLHNYIILSHRFDRKRCRWTSITFIHLTWGTGLCFSEISIRFCWRTCYKPLLQGFVVLWVTQASTFP